MKPDPVITATDIHKHFVQGEQDLHILRGIDLTVNQGERIAIVGLPETSGKLEFSDPLPTPTSRLPNQWKSTI